MQKINLFSKDINAKFNTWLHSQNIEVVLFDFDDTLIDTGALFRIKEKQFLQFCSPFLNSEDYKEFESIYHDLNTASFKVVGASPRKWEYIINELSKKYKHENFRNGLAIFQEIYKEVPVQFEGVKETLSILRECGARIGLVTHASQEWTDLKVDTLGLREFFEHIKVIDVEEHMYKVTQHWKEAIELFNVEPDKVLAVGDNVRGDIEAAYNAGVRQLALLPTGWHVYGEGEIPENVKIVDSIWNLIPALIGNEK